MGQLAVTSQLDTQANKPMLLLFGDGSVLPEINLIRIGFTGTTSDSLYRFGLYEHTNTGTGGTSVTPKRIGPSSPAVCTAKKGTFSADPTRTGIAMVTLTCHHRAVAAIQKEFGAGYKPSAMANGAGLGIWCESSPSTGSAEIAMNWWE